MNRETRDRLLLPILVPIGAIAVIAVLVLGFAQVLLSLTPVAATAVALVAAFGVLAVAARLTAASSVQWGGVTALIGAVAGIALLAGGFAIAMVGGPEEEAEEPEAELPVVAISAVDIQFDTDTLRVPANEPFIIRFANNDEGIPHNVSIFQTDLAEDPNAPILFQGEIFDGIAAVDYEVDPLEPGTYYFHCDVHPNMAGDVIAEEGVPTEEPPAEEPPAEEPPAEEPTEPAGASVTVAAQNIAFDTAEISIPADTPVDLTLDNREAVPHNLTIFSSSTGPEGDVLFRFDLFTGPATETHRIPPLPPGEYYFHCDAHPNMNGIVRVG